MLPQIEPNKTIRLLPGVRGLLPSVHCLRKLEASRWLPWFIIAAGILLRLRQYLFDRPLWLDEAYVALDIMHTPFDGLFKPLAHNQAPPVGFALLEKLAVQGFGTSEYVFRLIPFLAGVASLFLIYRVAQYFIAPRAVPIALCLFAISWPLTYYSSEAKQYSLDVAVALALYALALPMASLEWTSWRLILLGGLGALAIWFSHPSLFILAGMGITLSIACTLQKRWSRLYSLIVPFSLWAASFGLCYWTILRPETGNSSLLAYWKGSFAPFPPLSMKDVNWYINTLFHAFAFPGGIEATGLAVVLFVIGCTWLFARRRIPLLFLVIPIALTLAASAIHKYPFSGRLILFLAPAMILPVAEGVNYMWKKTSSFLITASILVVIFLVPTASACRNLVKGYTREDIRPVISYIRAHEKPEDTVYLYDGSASAYSYYAQREAMGRVIPITGTVESLNDAQYAKAVAQLRGRTRVWIVFSHLDAKEGLDEKAVFLDLLNHLGKRLDAFQAPGASTYLYNLQDSE